MWDGTGNNTLDLAGMECTLCDLHSACPIPTS